MRRRNLHAHAADSVEFAQHQITKRAIRNLGEQWSCAFGEACLAVEAADIDVLGLLGEEKFAEWRRFLQTLLETIEAFLADQRIGIFAIGHEQEPGLATIAHARQYRFHRTPCGLAAGTIAIETEIHIGGIAEQGFGVVAGRRGAERRHGLGDTVLMQGDHVHIAFDNQQPRDLLVRLAHLPHAEQFAALVEQRRLGRVQIFRIVFRRQHASAESNGATASIEDRKHHPIAEAVVFSATLATGQHAGFFKQRIALRRGAECVLQVVPAVGCVTQAKALLDVGIQAAICKIALRGFVFAEFVAEEHRRRIENVVKIRRVIAFSTCSFAWNLYADAGGKFFDRIKEFKAVVLHQELDRAAVRAATKAVIELLGRAHRERGRALVMERATRTPVAASFFHHHALPDHVDDIDASQQVIKKRVGNTAAHEPVRMPRQSAGGRSSFVTL